jgi:transposase-like protein
MLYVRFPLSLRNVEDLLHERGVGAGITRFATVAKRLKTYKTAVSLDF